MNTKLLRFLAVAVLITSTAALQSCGETAMLVPVEGPLSEARPVPVMSVKVQGIQSNSGKLSFLMPDGEKCSGRWSSAAGAGISSLLAQYGATYISGFSISTGHGQNPGQALAVCEKGRSFQLDFVTGAGTAHGFGIAKDSESNLYRFVF
jgi:hypothetical protein